MLLAECQARVQAAGNAALSLQCSQASLFLCVVQPRVQRSERQVSSLHTTSFAGPVAIGG